MLTLFRAEARRRWSIVKAYPTEPFFQVIILAGLFYMMFLGTSYIAGPTASFGSRLDNIFVGYLAWLIIFNNYLTISAAVGEESVQGTFFQLMTSPFSTRRILLLRGLASTLFDLTAICGVAAVIMLITGIRVHVSLKVIPIIADAVLAALGFGFLVGSVTLLFRREQYLMSILQYFILFAILSPLETWGPAWLAGSVFIPVGASAAALRSLLVTGHFDLVLYALSLTNTALFLGLGLFVFDKSEKLAKLRGIAGTY